MSDSDVKNGAGPGSRADRAPDGNILWPLALAATIEIASSRSQVASPLTFQQSDKVIHYLVFGLLATLIVRARVVRRTGMWRGWIAIIAVSLFGLSDELHQSFTPGRDVEVADWVMDTLGACTAVCAYLFWGGYRALLEMPLWGRKRDLPLKTDSSR